MNYIVEFEGHDGVLRKTKPFDSKLAAEVALVLIPFPAKVVELCEFCGEPDGGMIECRGVCSRKIIHTASIGAVSHRCADCNDFLGCSE